MTDERKPETPGMSEVSPKFVDEAEAAVEAAASTDEALSALWQEWQRLWETNKKAVEEAQDDKLANETFTALMAVEKRMEDMPARTAAGVWNKLQVAGVWIDTNRGSPDEDEMGVTERLTLSALADLGRMSQGIAPGAVKDPEIDNKGVTTRGLDPVAQIGRDLATIWRQVWRNDEEQPSAEDHVTRARLDRLELHLADRREALEAMAAEIQAGSLEGAMAQIMLAHAVADIMASTDETTVADMRTVSKLLYSALTALERVAAVPREEVAGEAYMRRDLDPHALVAGDETEGTA